MRKLNLAQHGAAWHKWRQQGFGGSDACTLMGHGFNKKPEDLIKSKVTGEVVDIENARMARGKKLEPEARDLYTKIMGMPMTPLCVEHEKYPWLRASLDGWNETYKVVLEIKCPTNPWVHRKALHGIYPHYYKPQLMHELLVTGGNEVHYWSYTDSEEFEPERRYALVVVKPEPDYLAQLFEVEKKNMEKISSLRKS